MNMYAHVNVHVYTVEVLLMFMGMIVSFDSGNVTSCYSVGPNRQANRKIDGTTTGLCMQTRCIYIHMHSLTHTHKAHR